MMSWWQTFPWGPVVGGFVVFVILEVWKRLKKKKKGEEEK